MLHGGRIHIAQQGELVDIHDRTNATMRQRIAGMCDIRDRARKLLAAQLDDVSHNALADLRRGPNGSYDRFVARHGCLTSRQRPRLPAGSDYPLLLSLALRQEGGNGDQGRHLSQAHGQSCRRTGVAARPEECWRTPRNGGGASTSLHGRTVQADAWWPATWRIAARVYRNPETGDHETADATCRAT
ncbi:MAG: hypothetical protein IPM01_27550 [Burkholderiaceae bacterium]|nr:hypothetical protein [Burkholderiaceae bacterium]